MNPLRSVMKASGAGLGALMLWVLWALPMGPADAQPVFQHALIIGVSKYADANIPPLDGVQHDMKSAREIASAMGIPGAQVTELRDSQATKARITEALNRLARDTTEGGRVLVYFSGHGTRWLDAQAGGCVEGLLTYDSQAIVNREFAALVEPIGAKADKLIIMFDACHSGGVSAFRTGTRSLSSGLSPKFFVKATQAPDSCSRPANMRTRSLLGGRTGAPGALAENVVQITSSRPDEVSFDDARTGGLATQGVRDCLLGKAKDLDGSGAITLSEIEACARDFVREKVRPFPDLLPHHVNVSGLRNLIAQPASPRPGAVAVGAVAATSPAQEEAVRQEKERLQREQQARVEQARQEALRVAELRAEQIRQEQARLIAEREAAERLRQQEQARLAAQAERQRQVEEEVRRRQEAERVALEAQAREREEAARRRLEAERLALAAQVREREEAARLREQQDRQAAEEAARAREEQARIQRELEERQRQERERARIESERIERERLAAAERDRLAREQEAAEQAQLAELARAEQRAAEEELARQQRVLEQQAREKEDRERLALMAPAAAAAQRPSPPAATPAGTVVAPTVLSANVPSGSAAVPAQPAAAAAVSVASTQNPASVAPGADSSAEVVAAVAALRDLYEQRDRRRLVQAVPSRKSLKIGRDPLELTVTASHDGYLYIVLLGSDEKSFYLLYPNGLDKDNRIKARVPLTLPRPSWEVVAAGPPGVDQLLVIVTEHPRRLSALTPQAANASAPFSYTGADAGGRRALVDFIVGAGVGAVSPRFGAHWIQIEEVP